MGNVLPRRRAAWLTAVMSLACAYVSVVSAPSAGADAHRPTDSSVRVPVAEATGPAPGAGRPIAQHPFGDRGYGVPDEAEHARAKAEANGRAGTRVGATSGSPEPSNAIRRVLRNWQGIDDTCYPSDSTGAIGTTRYVELVNCEFAIYNRASNTPVGSGTLTALTGGAGFIFDPQVIWDPTTNRFYYVADDRVSSTDHRLVFGFSKTANPNSAADWCKYTRAFGQRFPDYPKLGDTSNLLVIGANAFDGPTDTYLGSDVYGITKPPAGSACPAGSTFVFSQRLDVRDPGGNQVHTPVPANQTDGSTTGYVVSARSDSGNDIKVLTVTRNTNGTINLGAARSMPVASYSTPAQAPQPGTNKTLHTFDGRLTQAVSAIDPSRGSGTSVALWTQHTVFGGAGAQVRWYEINPVPSTPLPFKSGRQTDSNLFNFNAAIAPDRRRNGAAGSFGAKHVLFFNTSSTSEFVDIRATHETGTVGVGESTLLKQSTSRLDDESCGTRGPNGCRWGDYSAATPDPASATDEAEGVVWGTNAFTLNTASPTDWRTQNFAVQPK